MPVLQDRSLRDSPQWYLLPGPRNHRPPDPPLTEPACRGLSSASPPVPPDARPPRRHRGTHGPGRLRDRHSDPPGCHDASWDSPASISSGARSSITVECSPSRRGCAWRRRGAPAAIAGRCRGPMGCGWLDRLGWALGTCWVLLAIGSSALHPALSETRTNKNDERLGDEAMANVCPPRIDSCRLLASRTRGRAVEVSRCRSALAVGGRSSSRHSSSPRSFPSVAWPPRQRPCCSAER